MATNEERHQMIEREVLRHPEAIVDSSVKLWERLAVELIAIIGHDGFHTLYARSVHVAQAQFPWLGGAARFDHLKTNLQQQQPAQAGAASIALLTTITDTLIQLIGESLTTAILLSAWGHGNVDTAVKGIQ